MVSAMNDPPIHYFRGRDGAALAFREIGEGRPLVLIHGYFSTAAVNWIRYGHARTLAERGYRVVMPDLRAHGSSAAPHDPDGGPLYPGICRGLTEAQRAARANEPHALRLDMGRALIAGLTFEEEGEGTIAADPARFGDVVLARKDTPASYHLCVTHDDALQRVTLVTRGEDLKQSTHLHRLLQALMGWPTPVYAHHPLLTDATGRRLAKRDQTMTLRALRQAGVTAAGIRDRLARGDLSEFAVISRDEPPGRQRGEQ